MKFKNYLITIIIFFTAIINIYSQNIDTINSPEAFQLLSENNYNLNIIDGRDSVMFYSGHIKNAKYINAFSETAYKQLEQYLESDTLFIYCTNQRRSETIINMLIKLDFKGKIIYMQDGINGWKKNDFPVKIIDI
jgi:rhodanese-related sulfurtransferase